MVREHRLRLTETQLAYLWRLAKDDLFTKIKNREIDNRRARRRLDLIRRIERALSDKPTGRPRQLRRSGVPESIEEARILLGRQGTPEPVEIIEDKYGQF